MSQYFLGSIFGREELRLVQSSSQKGLKTQPQNLEEDIQATNYLAFGKG